VASFLGRGCLSFTVRREHVRAVLAEKALPLAWSEISALLSAVTFARAALWQFQRSWRDRRRPRAGPWYVESLSVAGDVMDPALGLSVPAGVGHSLQATARAHAHKTV
jgi:hypothetical protein